MGSMSTASSECVAHPETGSVHPNRVLQQCDSDGTKDVVAITCLYENVPRSGCVQNPKTEKTGTLGATADVGTRHNAEKPRDRRVDSARARAATPVMTGEIPIRPLMIGRCSVCGFNENRFVDTPGRDPRIRHRSSRHTSTQVIVIQRLVKIYRTPLLDRARSNTMHAAHRESRQTNIRGLRVVARRRRGRSERLGGGFSFASMPPRTTPQS